MFELDGLRLCSMLKVDSKPAMSPFFSLQNEPDERWKALSGDGWLFDQTFDNRELVAEQAILARPLSEVGHFRKLEAGLIISILKVTK